MRWIYVDFYELQRLNTQHLLGGPYIFPFELAV